MRLVITALLITLFSNFSASTTLAESACEKRVEDLQKEVAALKVLLAQSQPSISPQCIPSGISCPDFSQICCTDASFCSPGKFCP